MASIAEAKSRSTARSRLRNAPIRWSTPFTTRERRGTAPAALPAADIPVAGITAEGAIRVAEGAIRVGGGVIRVAEGAIRVAADIPEAGGAANIRNKRNLASTARRYWSRFAGR